jgi:outer membrane protein
MLKIQLLILMMMPAVFSVAQQQQTITLQQAIETGLQKSKNLKLADARIELANAKYNEAVDATIPSLKVSAGYTRLSDVPEFKTQFPGQTEPVALFPNIPNTYTTRASLSETIFSGFRLKYAQESQQQLRKAVIAESSKDSADLVFSVINSCFVLYKLSQSMHVVDQNIEIIDAHLKDAQNWEKEGIATHGEVLQWQMQHSNIEITKNDLQNNMNVVNYNLGLLLDMSNVTFNIDSASLFTEMQLSTLDQYMQQALSSRSEIQGQSLRSNASSNVLKVAQNSYYPNISIGANYYYLRPNQRYFPIVDEFRDSWDAGITLTWDITNLYSNHHNIAEAAANVKQAQVQQEVLSDAVKMEVNQDYSAVVLANNKIPLLQSSVLQAEENYNITNNKYINQLILQSEMLDAENALLQSKINMVIARADAQLSYYKLLKSTGSLLK